MAHAPATGRRRRLWVVAAGLAAIVAAAGCGAATSASTGATRGALAPIGADDPGLVHVHGLGVDPGDGTLYAATHTGLFAVPTSGRAQRLANRAQDTMGFSVVGDGTFLGSGHPDFREDDVRPPLLGLIASRDAGRTWDRLSLRGKADFHTLRAVRGLVYGYDSTSQTLMVSKDRKQWDRRAVVEMTDFAVSPTSADTVLATTPQGLSRSADGGRTFTPVPAAPRLEVLTWGPATQLYGVAADGRVYVSDDDGTSWASRGRVGGEPEALTADLRNGREVLYVAASERGILTSSDGGRTFTTRYAA